MANLKALAIFILLSHAAGIAGASFILPSLQGWYPSLAKPGFTPPAFVFLPVWLVLYTMMGIAAYLIWERRLRDRRSHEKVDHARHALYVFFIQLAQNVIWCYVFFGLHSPLYGLASIIFLWISIVLCIACFYIVSRKAAYLLMPYFLGVSFAMVLNFEIWRMNP